MLSTRALSYSYDGIRHLHYPDLDAAAGETLLVTGMSGSGKSTLLHLLGSLLSPSSGTIWLNGTELTALKAAKADRFRKENIGIVFQKAHFIKALSVKDNLRLAAHGSNGNDANRLMQELGIADLKHRAPATLSQGEQQRAAVARALINRPSLLLADEPTSNLDDHNAAQVIRLLQQQALAVAAALVIVTHDFRLKQIISKSIHLS
ncbi:ABC transporter ATP-binding protein [Filimonas effusa]|uniref:ATP-binding cassette domain-containing protein n=1 Tax=Filimonas effusa TaxID=2508721 RepID=A0A4Q1D9G5_9BACT|nr:ATP-binding cassette domain-containing protein [Filimonas effusa]RXK86022.1 ATP-binding cassette domain-containing protein [Filimonas effusa]